MTWKLLLLSFMSGHDPQCIKTCTRSSMQRWITLHAFHKSLFSSFKILAKALWSESYDITVSLGHHYYGPKIFALEVRNKNYVIKVYITQQNNVTNYHTDLIKQKNCEHNLWLSFWTIHNFFCNLEGFVLFIPLYMDCFLVINHS